LSWHHVTGFNEGEAKLRLRKLKNYHTPYDTPTSTSGDPTMPNYSLLSPTLWDRCPIRVLREHPVHPGYTKPRYPICPESDKDVSQCGTCVALLITIYKYSRTSGNYNRA
ncbi:hypothetical protein HDU92_000326, partial [Lobulomyces angularis]